VKIFQITNEDDEGTRDFGKKQLRVVVVKVRRDSK
jgi:hypothetical protein